MQKIPTHIHIHTTILWPFFQDYPGARRNILVQRKITEANTPTTRVGATPSQLISDPPHPSHHFYAGCLSYHNPPTLSWLRTGTKYADLHTQWRGSSNINKPVKN